ncbi:MAG: EAL domain-containing protein [Acidimicrobiales bacterium]|nr:EAL domain-containing protein [Acidimicrobiales bacterium]
MIASSDDPTSPSHPRLNTVAEYIARLDHMLVRKPSSTDIVASAMIEATRTEDSPLSASQHEALGTSIVERMASMLDIADTIAVSATGRFMILIENVESKTALVGQVAALGDAIARPHLVTGTPEAFNVRIALAFADSKTRSATLLMRQARMTLGLTPAGALEIYCGDEHSTRINRSELKADLVRALRDDQLDVVYQPVLDVHSGEMVGFEALMRWHHPTRGVIGPMTFLPIADELGLVPDMGRWLIDRAAAQLRMWDLDYPSSKLNMAVNISKAELNDHGLANSIERICRRRSVSPERFVLEVSERSITDAAAPLLAALSRTGAHIALDDFGTGSRSLAELQEMPIDLIKIDRAVMAKLDRSDDENVAGSIVELGKLLGVPLVAEGVERPSQAALLTPYGFDYAQGHLFARPMTAAAADALLAQAIAQSWRIEAPAAVILDW